jgi:hypothetical protein
MSVFRTCERAIGLMRGKRLILSAAELSMLNALDYEGLVAAHAQDEAISCVRHFDAVRDRLLVANPWVFSRKSAAPAELANPLPGWRHSFALPADCLKILSLIIVFDTEYGRRKSAATVEQWEQVGQSVGCRYRIIDLRYTARINDTLLWDPLFSDVFCFSLAMEISASVTGDAGVQQMMEQRAMLGIQRAVEAGAIKAPTAVPMEHYGWHGYSDRCEQRYDRFAPDGY